MAFLCRGARRADQVSSGFFRGLSFASIPPFSAQETRVGDLFYAIYLRGSRSLPVAKQARELENIHLESSPTMAFFLFTFFRLLLTFSSRMI